METFNQLIKAFVVTVLFSLTKARNKSESDPRPNFLIFMADDVGYGDIGCFGNTTLATPNIDRLAERGTKLTHVLAASAICTPSRAAFLTGRYPVRSGMAPNFYGVNIFLASRSGLPAEELTFSKLLQSSGYSTSLIGKWHLGFHCDRYGDKCHHPSTHGFDHFYGLPLSNMKDWDPETSERIAERIFPHLRVSLLTTSIIGGITVLWLIVKRKFLLSLMTLMFLCAVPVLLYVMFDHPCWMNGALYRNEDIVEQPVRVWTLARRFVEEGKLFIDTQITENKPFLLFFSFTHAHTFLSVHPEFKGRSGHGSYGDAVQEMDWAIGQMMDFIETKQIINETVVIFTSDHGADIEISSPDGESLGGRNGLFSGGKNMFGMEGGIRVPTIFSWLGKLPEGNVLNTTFSLMDIFPTLIHLARIDTSLDEMSLDGKDLVPFLTGELSGSPHQFLFHYGKMHTIHAVTYIENETSIWKVHFHFPTWKNGTRLCYYRCPFWKTIPQDPPVIYNIITDPSESTAVSHMSDKYKEVLSKTKAAVVDHEASVQPVDSQLTFANVVWRPWLQPCCRLLFCMCEENITSLLT